MTSAQAFAELQKSARQLSAAGKAVGKNIPGGEVLDQMCQGFASVLLDVGGWDETVPPVAEAIFDACAKRLPEVVAETGLSVPAGGSPEKET